MNTQLALVLPARAAPNAVVINARCTLRREDEQCVIVVVGLPVHHYRADDAVAQAYAMMLLVESGFAQQTEVARAFSVAERTVRRYQERYAQDGMIGLGREATWRRGRRRVSSKRLRHVETLQAQGLSNRAIAQRLGVTSMPVIPSQCESHREADNEHTQQQSIESFRRIECMSEQICAMSQGECGSEVGKSPLQNFVLFDSLP